MTVTINARERRLESDSLTVGQLLEQLELGYPVLVEHNGRALFEREFDASEIRDGDRLELFRVASGG